ncbi:thioredoxin family protein [Stieleria sp. JC731]|uniref:thioredoxin family protein n=1 Tax=Pirellulaceae TaxID=2691357 RepID=UPI001E5A7C1F|nr:thioredoxin family protein [Stieleria sp. JC731]MCC9603079.1 thioredoxin family protein [Stieleria sp. JC731]
MLILSATFQSPTWAGKYNTVVNIGDEAPQWQDLPGTDGKLHSSDELKDAKATVVVFTCNSCPYAIDAESRLIDLAKAYESKGVQIVAVNVNKVEEDLLPAMKERAELKKYPFTYLFDESQKIAKDFGAKYTPEFFLLDAQRKIVYMGSMDDSPDGKDVKQQYLRSAIEAVLNGQTVTDSETVPIGCRIRLERERRRRR